MFDRNVGRSSELDSQAEKLPKLQPTKKEKSDAGGCGGRSWLLLKCFFWWVEDFSIRRCEAFKIFNGHEHNSDRCNTECGVVQKSRNLMVQFSAEALPKKRSCFRCGNLFFYFWDGVF